jgi:cysteine desulfurase
LDRIYLDTNATSPLAPAVKSWLAKGDFVFANPASQHTSGKKSAFLLDEVRDFLFSLYQLDQKKYDLFFHSGATEGVNTFALSRSPDPSSLFVYGPTDHACVRMQKERFSQSCELRINAQGELLLEESIEAINAFKSKKILLNFTWVHNETGVVWPLAQALALKERTGAMVHVDAPQTIGKIKDWHQLSSELDMYSFSSHKCGALKSHGWSFVKKKSLSPLMLGGGQQQRLRSGTENTMAAMALMLALDELHQNWKPEASLRLMQEIRHFLDQSLAGVGSRVCAQAHELNTNTALFYFHSLPSDQTLPLFDLAGLELSSGAACSSGAAKESHVLKALGLSTCAKNALRLSLNWDFSVGDWGKLQPRLLQVIEKIKAKT